MASKAKPTYPRTISFGSGKVRVRKRGNGFFDLVWREMGSNRKTTKSGEEKALEFAEQKARELDAGSGRQWVARGESEAMEAIRKLAGDGEGAVRRLIDDVRDALHWLEGEANLTAAAKYFSMNGPIRVERVTAAVAIARFLGEYETAPKDTRDTFNTELSKFAKRFPDLPLLDVTHDLLQTWCRRKVNVKGGGLAPPAPKTEDNRITTWCTFLTRSRELNLLPAHGKHAGELLKRPTIPDSGKAIFTVDQGMKLLRAVIRRFRKLLPYLLIGGWLGLRPSEIQRLTWEGFDWDTGYLHVTVKVAGKNSSERYIKMDPRLQKLLHWEFLRKGKKRHAKVCGHRSREFLSQLARDSDVCEVWPTDVLRHSFCSYRIAVVKSHEQVATEADNSPKILKAYYRRPLRHEDGLAWWDLLDGLLELLAIPAVPEDAWIEPAIAKRRLNPKKRGRPPGKSVEKSNR